jgi:hypothetical protein
MGRMLHSSFILSGYIYTPEPLVRAQFRQKACEVRVASTKRHIRIPKPAHISEFVLIIVDGLTPRGRDDVPKRHVNVARGEARGHRACDHQRLFNVVRSTKPEFLAKFARHCISRMFPWLDVTSRRQPELRTFVIYEKNFAAVYHGKV